MSWIDLIDQTRLSLLKRRTKQRHLKTKQILNASLACIPTSNLSANLVRKQEKIANAFDELIKECQFELMGNRNVPW
ncbi:hypothetical protein GQ457_06G021090 [Hibiscus cannabinus]